MSTSMEWINKQCNGVHKHASKALVGLGCFLALIGAYTLVTWSAEVFFSRDNDTCMSQTPDTCPWKHVFSDISNRLQMLEMAFKEQVIAREVMEKEVLNQSDVNGMLVEKLSAILRKLDALHEQYRIMRTSLTTVENRVQSDEVMGAGMVLVIIFELLLILVPQKYLSALYLRPVKAGVVEKSAVERDPRPAIATGCTNGATVVNSNNTQTKNGVLSYSPKHGVSLKNEICIVVLNKDNGFLVQTITDTLLRGLDGVKVAIKPHILIQSQDEVRCLPRVKLFMVFVDCDKGGTSSTSLLGPGSGSPASGSRPSAAGVELTVSTIRYAQSITGQLIITFTNDEGSRRLTANAMYNSNLKPVHSHEILRDFAAKGRLFTMYRDMTSHQISHMRKLIMTALSFRTGLIPSREER